MRIKNYIPFLVFIIFPFIIFAQSNDVVEGIVLGADKAVLENAVLRIGGTTAISLNDGSFYFDGIPSGKHGIEVTAMGYETLRDTIIKTDSEKLTLEIQMSPWTYDTTIELSEVTVQAKTVGQQLKEQPIRTVVINTQ